MDVISHILKNVIFEKLFMYGIINASTFYFFKGALLIVKIFTKDVKTWQDLQVFLILMEIKMILIV